MVNPTLYASLVAKVQAKRLQYANKLAVLASVALGLLISRSLGSCASSGSIWWSLLMVLSCWAPLLLILFLLIRLSRDRSTITTYPDERTWASYLTAIFISGSFYWSSLYYSALALIIFAVSLALAGPDSSIPLSLVSKEYRVRNRINDDFIYYFFGAIYTAIVYAFVESVAVRNRLPTLPQIYRVVPQKALFVHLPRLLARSVALTVVVGLLALITYIFLRNSLGYSLLFRPLMYIMGLDKPALFVTLPVIIRTFVSLFHTVLAWELFNHVYNVYASIGCLDGSKLISLYSEEPLSTLINGQRFSSGGITRLTAFQELALVATTSERELLKTRLAIYNTKDGLQRSYWPQILEECLLVLREATARVTKRDGVAHVQQKEPPKLDIFGNSQGGGGGGSLDSKKETVSNEATIKKYVTPATKKSSFETAIEPVLAAFNRQVIQPIESVLESAIDSAIGLQFLTSKQALTHVKKSWSTYSQEFLVSILGAPFRTSLYLDSRARIDDPTTYGNAAVAVSGLLIHAVEEDRVGLVLNRNIAEVLTTLERLIRTCGEYTENPPVFRGPEPSKQMTTDHQVALLHDIAMQQFYDVCIKYNYKLNDLVLSQRAFKLAKLVIDAAIAQQRHG